MSSITLSFPQDWLESVGSRILFELDPKSPILMSCQSKMSLGSCQWSLLETPSALELFHSKLKSPVTGLTATVSRGLGMVALCGMSTRGLWDGTVTSNGGRCHMEAMFLEILFHYCDYCNY